MTKTLSVSALALAATLAATLAAAGPALAGPTCTDAPRDTWLSEAAMRQKITDMGYTEIRIFKVTKGNCYEMYGFDREGKRAEVYFHPVTGEPVEAK